MKDKDQEYRERRGAKIARAMRGVIGVGYGTPKTEAECAGEAEFSKWVVGHRCRTQGCGGHARFDGWCYHHRNSRPKTMLPVPPVPGRCNAIAKKKHRDGRSRCRTILREGETRCPIHRGYTEPEILL